METTARSVIDSVVRSVCGHKVERLVRLTSGGLHETYRVEAPNHVPAIVRIARRPVPWFTDEEHAMAQARGVGVPTPDVLGVEQVDHDGELLSFSILRLMPGRSGVCALLYDSPGRYEISKMTVRRNLRGHGIGRRLLSEVILRARGLGARQLFVISNTVLEPAIHLYQQFGFLETPLPAEQRYGRGNIALELALS